ncbi:two pore domain potassium channel family protein [Phycicoccus sp. CSK15P-2]|uniref:two pore domain potassium channel family protein n=1 Tax=Phycicoccus sp. CSK15P-2 TaxID=2807627 RepID=UPI0019518F64|nr:two pore domain potassium channel family protein [Phycicoccus sp. CSK15P-2]MBM6404997.1 two pore domain potassium channel family protein [Phycicoccus sp. CSK15P-2]
MTLMWEELQEPPSTWGRWKATLRKQPSAFLLVAQITVILLLPFLQTSGEQYKGVGRAVISLLSLAAVIIAVFTVRSTPALTWLSVGLGVPATVLEVWSLFEPANSGILVAAHLALAIFYLYTAYALISYMFEDYWVTKDELFAVGACFTVLVFAFAYLFLAIQEVWPHSFTSYEGPGQRSFLELLYFSGANLTSVGLSDVGPIKPQARALVTVEQLGGVLYVAMVISRLVALTVMRARQ